MKIQVDGWAWLPKSEMTEGNISWLKEELTINQKVSEEYKKRSTPAIVHLWKDTEDRFGVPRAFFLEGMTKNHTIEYSASAGLAWPDRIPSPKLDDGSSSWPQSETVEELTLYDSEENKPVTLRPSQVEAIAVAEELFDRNEVAGGLVQLGTGMGKSLLAMELIRRRKLKAAVLVHREFLANQWRKTIARYMPDAKVGLISGSKWEDVEDSHICIVMVQTIASWVKKNKVPPELSGLFGIVVMDEVHRGGAPHWGLAMPAFNSKYRLGLSANPRRSDGLDNVIKYHIGQKIYTGTTVMMTPKIKRVWSNFKIEHPRLNPQFMSMEFAFKLLSANEIYNQDITDQVKKALEAGRKVLVYSITIKHLNTLKELLDKQWVGKPITTSFFIGGMTEDEQDESAGSDCIFATLQMAKDALDIPAIDTVVLGAPLRNPQQPVGRGCREYPNKKQPVVVDMRVDGVPILREYGESRDKAYIRLYGEQSKPVVVAQTVVPEVKHV